MENRVRSFSLDIGLEDIERYDDPLRGLPAQRETQLTGGQVRQRVDELFSKGTLEQTMRRFVCPRLSNPAVLVPARFEALVRESAKTLHSQAKDSEHPELQRAGELLDHELKLRDLLASYRNMLMKA